MREVAGDEGWSVGGAAEARDDGVDSVRQHAALLPVHRGRAVNRRCPQPLRRSPWARLRCLAMISASSVTFENFAVILTSPMVSAVVMKEQMSSGRKYSIAKPAHAREV